MACRQARCRGPRLAGRFDIDADGKVMQKSSQMQPRVWLDPATALGHRQRIEHLQWPESRGFGTGLDHPLKQRIGGMRAFV